MTYSTVPESFETKTCITGWNCLYKGPERPCHEALDMMFKLQWRPQNAGDANAVEHLVRIAVGTEWNQPRKSLYGLHN